MPLTYPSILSIMPHLHPNQRLGLLEKCPSFRTVNNLFPMRVNNVEIKKCQITIHDKEYKVGIVRHYPGDVPPPEWIRLANEAGGTPHDVGAFGDPYTNAIQAREGLDGMPTIPETIAKEEAEAELKVLLPKSQWRNQNSQHREYEKVQMSKRVSELQKIIRSYNEQMAISELHFIEYVQLRITDAATQTQKFERVNYETPIHVAMYNLAKLLLDRKTIYTRELTFDSREGLTWPNTLSIKIERDFKMEIRDRQIVSIEFPLKRGEFSNFSSLRIKFRRDRYLIAFQISEENYQDTINNLLNMVMDDAAPEQMARLTERHFPAALPYSVAGIDTGGIRVERHAIGNIARYEITIFASTEIPMVFNAPVNVSHWLSNYFDEF
ncbi:unnamed protein product [Caenorhabditis brenneri]